MQDALENVVYSRYIDMLGIGTAQKSNPDPSPIKPKVRVTVNLFKLPPNTPVLKSYSYLKKLSESFGTNVIKDDFGNKAEILE